MRTFELVGTLPTRNDKGSAGYDFYCPYDVTIEAGKTVIVWSGVRALFPSDEVLMLYLRSSVGIKNNLMLANGTGVIDASYQREIGIPLHNYGETPVRIAKGERIAQGVFLTYETTGDAVINDERTGGMGSTGK